MESLILGLGGDFNLLSVQESEFGGAPLGDDQFDYDSVLIDYLSKTMWHLGAIVAAVFVVLIVIFKLRV